jgi:hypothetical protein
MMSEGTISYEDCFFFQKKKCAATSEHVTGRDAATRGAGVERRESAPQGRPSGNQGRGRRDANANAPDRQERTRPRPAPSSPASRRGGSRLACHPHLLAPFAWLEKYAPAAQHAPLPSLPSRSPPPPSPASAPAGPCSPERGNAAAARRNPGSFLLRFSRLLGASIWEVRSASN